MENIDSMIETATELRKLIRTYQGLLQRFERGTIRGPYLTRSVFADEFRKMARDAAEIESLCLETARYFVREIAQANKTPGRLQLSTVQTNQLVNFLEMMKQPLFPILIGAQSRHPGFNTAPPRPDC